MMLLKTGYVMSNESETSLIEKQERGILGRTSLELTSFVLSRIRNKLK